MMMITIATTTAMQLNMTITCGFVVGCYAAELGAEGGQHSAKANNGSEQHVTRHTSRVTRHASRVTRHASPAVALLKGGSHCTDDAERGGGCEGGSVCVRARMRVCALKKRGADTHTQTHTHTHTHPHTPTP